MQSKKLRPGPIYGTIPEASRIFGIGLKRLRQCAAEGCFPVYMAGASWPRVKLSEVEEWLQSTRVQAN